MRAVTAGSLVVRHSAIALAEAILLAIILGSIALGLSPVFAPAGAISGISNADAGRLGHIEVVRPLAALAEGSETDSIFTAWGCDFRANSTDYYMVVRGPAPDTASLAYWVDPFPVGTSGCGNATVSWTSSGVAGDFDVWVARSASGNPWQAKPASNVVTVTITNP